MTEEFDPDILWSPPASILTIIAPDDRVIHDLVTLKPIVILGKKFAMIDLTLGTYRDKRVVYIKLKQVEV